MTRIFFYGLFKGTEFDIRSFKVLKSHLSFTLPVFLSLIYIVLSLLQQAEHTKEPMAAAKFSQKAKKFGIIAIMAWITLLASIPILMALVSYLFTLVE